MSRPLEQLEAEALNLVPPERATLPHRLLASLDDEEAERTPVEFRDIAC